MVVAKAWLSHLRPHVGTGPENHLLRPEPDDPAPTIGILSFETATTMTRLVSLHRSLSDPEISALRSETMRSEGVSYLNSTDQSFLLRLACAEMMDDLDRAAAAISRLGRRCSTVFPRGFDRIYADLKAGSADLDRAGLGFPETKVEKKVRRMERYVASTASLCVEMEVVSEMEASEKKRWIRYSGPIAPQKPEDPDQFRLELKSRRRRVRRLMEESLWNKTFDKVVEFMARAACSVFVRICVVFGRYLPGLLPVIINPVRHHHKLRIYPNFSAKHSSGPLERKVAKEVIIRNSCPILGTKAASEEARRPCGTWNKVLEAGPSTVGGSGLTLRYANVIVASERLLLLMAGSTGAEGEEETTREELYELLPVGLRGAVRGKLRDCWRNDPGPLDGGLADGWKDAVWRILGWLGPVARDTIRWQIGRSMDRRRQFEAGERVLMLQTLHFSDREKTEAAIVEVLVGLSCMCWYEERRQGTLRF